MCDIGRVYRNHRERFISRTLTPLSTTKWNYMSCIHQFEKRSIQSSTTLTQTVLTPRRLLFLIVSDLESCCLCRNGNPRFMSTDDELDATRTKRLECLVEYRGIILHHRPARRQYKIVLWNVINERWMIHWKWLRQQRAQWTTRNLLLALHFCRIV